MPKVNWTNLTSQYNVETIIGTDTLPAKHFIFCVIREVSIHTDV